LMPTVRHRRGAKATPCPVWSPNCCAVPFVGWIRYRHGAFGRFASASFTILRSANSSSQSRLTDSSSESDVIDKHDVKSNKHGTNLIAARGIPVAGRTITAQHSRRRERPGTSVCRPRYLSGRASASNGTYPYNHAPVRRRRPAPRWAAFAASRTAIGTSRARHAGWQPSARSSPSPGGPAPVSTFRKPTIRRDQARRPRRPVVLVLAARRSSDVPGG